jgi:hypothetical protein
MLFVRPSSGSTVKTREIADAKEISKKSLELIFLRLTYGRIVTCVYNAIQAGKPFPLFSLLWACRGLGTIDTLRQVVSRIYAGCCGRQPALLSIESKRKRLFHPMTALSVALGAVSLQVHQGAIELCRWPSSASA